MPPIPPTLKEIDPFIVTGFSVRTQNSDESNQTKAKIPELWQQFHTSALALNAPPYGVYSDYASDAHGLYTVTAGVKNDNPSTEFDTIQIQAGHYLVFQGFGPMPLAVIETWQQVWRYFATNQEYQRRYLSDFEIYNGPEEVAIYIGIHNVDKLSAKR